jgi:glycerol 3-phosphatase-2
VTTSVLDDHDVVLLDLDGTVYLGGKLIPGAGEAIAGVHRKGIALRYVTNNASKTPHDFAVLLAELGLPAQEVEVSTSSQAAAAMLAERLSPGARVLIIGADALASEVEKAGLQPVRRSDERPVAVVQGYSPDTGWRDLAEGCLAIRDGALWVATNVDVTLPTERGEVPGNGAMVAAVRAATGQAPIVAGKPERPLLDSAVASAGGSAPLLVGDRLDTDIGGAVTAGIPALLVLTGAGKPRDALAAAPDCRPTYVAADISALHRPVSESVIAEQPAWKVEVQGTVLELSAGSASPPDGTVDALRALCAAWWPVGSGAVEVRPKDQQAAEVLQRLGLR